MEDRENVDEIHEEDGEGEDVEEKRSDSTTH